MAFYAGAIVRDPVMENPTIVVLTDRNDLDDQLFGTFSRCRDLLRQAPTQASNRADLRRKLSVVSGGVVFTTIQKFFPEEKGDTHPMLSARRNIVVIADEAHRSQYDFIDGFARQRFKFWAMRRFALLLASWCGLCEIMSRLIGRCERMCARICAGWSSAFCANTGIRRIRPMARRLRF